MFRFGLARLRSVEVRVHDGLCVCVCVFVVISFILDVRLVEVPAGVTQEGGHTGFMCLPSAVLTLIFLARRIQQSLSLIDREIAFWSSSFIFVSTI